MDLKGNFNTNQRNKLRGNGDERRDGREEKIKHTETSKMNNRLQRIQTDNKKKLDARSIQGKTYKSENNRIK